MYKLILVDDEPFILQGLNIMIDWGKYGFEICGQARNGYSAIDLINKTSPDLVITDIKLPDIDGLRLIKYIKSTSKNDINFIIISGHDKFEFAKKAISYNVIEYLLKPVIKTELINAINKVNAKIKNSKPSALVKENSYDIFQNNLNTHNYKDAFDFNFELLVEAIEFNNTNKIIIEIDKLISSFEEKNIPLVIQKANINSFGVQIVKMIRKANGDTSDILNTSNFFRKLSTITDISILKKLVISFSLDCSKYLHSLKNSDITNLMFSLQEYINNNYQNQSLKLKTLSKKFFLTPSYMGQLFKKEFGIYFNDYLNNIRIEKAKYLILSTNKKIYEISEIVGYNNPDYFINIFKKNTSMSPTQFKQESKML